MQGNIVSSLVTLIVTMTTVKLKIVVNMEREKEGLPPLPEAADPGKGHQQGRGFIDSLLSSPVMLVGGLVNGVN